MVNLSVTWEDWDEELLALELQELNAADFDLTLTGFDPKEIDDLLLDPDEYEREKVVPPLAANPVSRVGDLWICEPHRVLCGDATSEDSLCCLLEDRKPLLMVRTRRYESISDFHWERAVI